MSQSSACDPTAPTASAGDCASLKRQEPLQWRSNEVATNLATSILAITIIFYICNICCLIFQNSGSRKSVKKELKWPGLAVSSLSALLAAAIGLIFVFATTAPWPQPLEAAGLLVIALAQASTLGWQDHDRKGFWTDLWEKIPDILSVIVSAYALGDARNKYIELTCNTFYLMHDPWNMMIIAYVLAGTGFVVGLIQEALISNFDEHEEEILKRCSVPFLVIQTATTVVAIVFGQSTVAEGCLVFNITKISAMSALGLGNCYSVVFVFLRPLR